MLRNRTHFFSLERRYFTTCVLDVLIILFKLPIVACENEKFRRLDVISCMLLFNSGPTTVSTVHDLRNIRKCCWKGRWNEKLYATVNIVTRSLTMHLQSHPLTIGGTVLSDDLVILGVTFDSKMTFEKHLRSVSRAAFQRLGILRKSWRVFHDRSLLVRCFRCFVQPVLEYCSTVWCSATDIHLRLLDREVSGENFTTGGVFDCDIARRSAALLWVPCKIGYNPMLPLSGVVPGPCMPVRVTHCALTEHRYTYSIHRCRTSQ